jgi:hypothetical protein
MRETKKPFAHVFSQRCEQLGLVTQQQAADFINQHAVNGEPATITRFSVCDWQTGRYAPARRYHDMIGRAMCLTREQVTLLCAGLLVQVAALPSDDEQLGADHAQ